MSDKDFAQLATEATWIDTHEYNKMVAANAELLKAFATAMAR